MHGSAVRFDEMADEGQPKSKPAVTARGAAFCLTETLKDVRQELRVDAFAAVLHRQFHVRANAQQRDLDRPVLGG